MDKESFGTKTGLKDWLQVKIKKCTFIGIDYKSLLNKHINISNIDIKGVDLEDYKNLKIKSQPMRKRLLYQQLHHANIPIKIKKISFKDFNLTYEEMPLVGNNPGLLTIKDLSGDITNINSTGPTDSYFTLAAKGDIMGKAPLSIKWDMPNHSINNNFIVEGKLENADLDIFNPITIPLAHIQLKEGGKIDELKFTVTGDSLNSKARMNMHYHNLHVNFVKDKV